MQQIVNTTTGNLYESSKSHKQYIYNNIHSLKSKSWLFIHQSLKQNPLYLLQHSEPKTNQSMRYGTDNSESSNRYRGGAVSPSSYQNNNSSNHYQSNYDYQPPSVAGTYAQQQTYVMEDTMRTHYEVRSNYIIIALGWLGWGE
jgi:hypothetical protein